MQSAGNGNPYIILQDGRQFEPVYRQPHAAGSSFQTANSGAPVSPDQARPLSLASGDLNVDGFPDLICGYSGPNGGILTLHRGDPQAFAPENSHVLQGIANKQFPDPFIKEADIFELPEAPDFVGVGDFNRDGKVDVIVAARGGSAMYLLAGNDEGLSSSPRRVELPGALTAMATGDINQGDGILDVIVAVNTPSGPTVLLYEGPYSLLETPPAGHALPAEAKSITIGMLDDDGFVDVAIVAGDQLLILHGQVHSDSSAPAANNGRARLEAVSLPFAVDAVALGEFIWDRESRMEMAVLARSGAVHILARGELDKRPFTEVEALQKRRELARMRAEAEQARERGEPVDMRPASRSGASLRWGVVEEISAADTSRAVGAVSDGGSSHPILLSTRISALPSDDLLIMNPSTRQIQLMYREEARPDGPQLLAQTAERSSVTLESESEMVAVLPMRVNLDARPGLVIMSKGGGAPSIVMPTAGTTFTVSSAADSAAAGSGSLRRAIIDANANPGADMIVINAGINPTLTITSGGLAENAAATGDLDINDSVSIMGQGAGSTIISTTYNSSCGDCKVFGVGQLSTPGLSVSFAGVTIQNGFNNGAGFQGTFFETGGGVDFFLFGSGNTYSMSNCIVNNNTVTGSALSHGAGINVDSANTATPAGPSAGTVTFTNVSATNNTSSTFGAGIVLAADKHDVTMTDCSSTGNTATQDGGGIWIRHSFGGTINISKTVSGTSNISNNSASQGGGITVSGSQVLSITNVTINSNTATGAGMGVPAGGGILIVNLGAFGVTGNNTLTGVTISNNQAVGVPAAEAGASGGGLHFNSNYPATLNNCTISGNTSLTGGGVFHGGSGSTPASQLTINGGLITGNMAHTNGGGYGMTDSINAVGVLDGLTVQSNAADSDNNGSGNGGGIHMAGGTLTLNNNVVVGVVGLANTANNGGGIAVEGGAFNYNSGSINANSSKINGGGLHISDGPSPTAPTVTLTGIPVRRNIADSDNNNTGDGGAIFRSAGTLTLNGAVNIGGTAGAGNSARNGGGIANTAGNLTLNSPTIRGNSATGDGGGILASGGTITLSGGVIQNNTATGNGGGIRVNGGAVIIQNNTPIGAVGQANMAGNGGGVSVASGSFTYDGAAPNGGTINGNTATGNGGGVHATGGTVDIDDLTFTNNSASSGGALFNQGATFSVNLSRIHNNMAGTGSGITSSSAANVENNWWGCDAFPNTGGCQTGSGTFDADPRLDAKVTATPATVPVTATSAIEADFSMNSNNQAVSPIVLIGLTVNFSATLGTVLPTSDTIDAAFKANTLYTAPPTCDGTGQDTVSAQLDNPPAGTVIVQVTQPPSPITCPTNITGTADPGQCTSIENFATPTSTGCPTVTVTCNPASGFAFPLGTTTVTCTASNGIAPDQTCTFTVTITDDQPPTITCPANITQGTDPGQCSAV
ncbi:MAG TPA: HYR domain-containing protein, partial [Candidatus Entotheonella sp.]